MHGLRQHEHDKTRQRELTSKSIGLAKESVKPLETQGAPRGGRAGNAAGPHIQRAANADAHGAADDLQMIADPIFLIRKTERDEHEIGAGAKHEARDVVIVIGVEVAVVHARDHDAAIARGQGLSRRFRDTRSRAEHEDAHAARFVCREHSLDEIDARHAFAERPADHPRGPDDADGVRHHEVCTVHGVAVAVVARGQHRHLGPERDHVCRTPISKPPADDLGGAGSVNRVDPAPENREGPAAQGLKR